MKHDKLILMFFIESKRGKIPTPCHSRVKCKVYVNGNGYIHSQGIHVERDDEVWRR